MTTMQDPARNAEAVTLDAEIIGSRGLYVGATGDVAVEMVGGGTVTFVGVQGVLPVRPRRVLSAGTTAASIVVLL